MAITKVSITFVKLVPASNPPAETAFTPLDNVVLSLSCGFIYYTNKVKGSVLSASVKPTTCACTPEVAPVIILST